MKGMHTMSKEETQAERYSEKGMIRQMIILPEAARDHLKAVAKQFKLTQGEVVEVLLAVAPEIMADLEDHFEAKRANRKDGRTTKAELVKSMKGLTPEQIVAIQAIIDAK